MSEEGESGDESGFVSTVLTSGRSEHGDLVDEFYTPQWGTHEFTDQTSGSPETTALVKEGRNLSGNSTVTIDRSADAKGVEYIPSWATKDQTVDGFEIVGSENGVFGLQRTTGMHLGQDFLREGLLAGCRCQ